MSSAAQQAAYEHRQRENNIFAACRSRVINEPALLFRAPEHEGAMIGDAVLRSLVPRAEAMVRAQMAERGVIVPAGTIKFGGEHGS